jgi:hypothetical protein
MKMGFGQILGCLFPRIAVKIAFSPRLFADSSAYNHIVEISEIKKVKYTVLV